MSKLKSWFSKRRWRKQHQADIRAFMRFQTERSARRRSLGQPAPDRRRLKLIFQDQCVDITR